MITFEELKKANESINLTPIKGKDYAEVNQRIKAFRMVYPCGSIVTEMMSNENGVCIFKATISDGVTVLGTGTAYEREDSSYINKTSYIENCETSAVGRALGMCGFGIDTSVASAEEVQNAMLNQDQKATPKQIEYIGRIYKGERLEKLLKLNNINKLDELPMSKASEIISALTKVSKKEENIPLQAIE